MDRLALRPAPTDVTAVVQRVVNAIAALAWRQGKVLVMLEAAADPLYAQTDEQRLRRVLIALLHDAVRRTLPGGLVAVRLSRRPAAIVIQVQDTGGGSADLGLAPVEELIEALGGAVAVESTPGAGSCVTVTLESLGGFGRAGDSQAVRVK